ncbi:MAG TPA: hypothetical protein DCQ90_09695 [Erysipelotrichaceae bacterium]|nr:hypothetical protein [Erysipelotrichaceae bacterium]
MKTTRILGTLFMAFILFLFSFSPSSSPTSPSFPSTLTEQIIRQILELEGKEVKISETYALLDVELKNNYTLALFRNAGYAIITNRSYILSEYSIDDSKIPFEDVLLDDVDLIYGGPSNYLYTRDRKDYFDADTQREVAFTPSMNQIEVNKRLVDGDSEEEEEPQAIQDPVFKPLVWTGIHESLFIRYNAGMWINNQDNYPIGNGMCGPISVAILLAYYQDNIDPSFVPSAVRTRGSLSPGSLVHLLGLHIGGAYTGTIGITIYYGFLSFMESYGIDQYQPKFTMFTTWDIVTQKVDQMRPIAVGLTTWLGGPESYGNHWVTVYAYAQNTEKKGYYKAIDNHGDYKARIKASWTVGAVWLDK